MKKLILLVVTLLTLNSGLVTANDALASFDIDRMQAIADNNLSLEDEKIYATFLRNAYAKAIRDENSDLLFRISQIFIQMRFNIRNQYPQLTDQEYENAHYSVAVGLGDSISTDEKIELLIREGNLLSTPAQIMLQILYNYSTDNLGRYDNRILSFFKKHAEEGIPVSQLEYGKILLDGIGVEKNEEEGLRLLKESAALGKEESYIELSRYYYNANDMENFEHYLKLSASAGDEQAIYNLAVLEQTKGNYEEALALFEETRALNSNYYYDATIELGRMYIEGWGVEKDIERGLAMMHEVVQNAQEEDQIEIAQENIRRFEEMVE